jgi:hypothetical protein
VHVHELCCMCNLTSCSILPSLVICALNGDRCCQPTFVRLTKHCAFETCHVHTLRRAWCLIRGERAVPMRGLQYTTVMLEHDAWREHRSNSSEPSATHILKYTLLLTKVRYVELDDERTRTERARRPVDQGDTIHLVRVWPQHKNHIPTLRPALVADRRAFMIEVRPPPSPTPRVIFACLENRDVGHTAQFITIKRALGTVAASAHIRYVRQCLRSRSAALQMLRSISSLCTPLRYCFT